MQEKHKRAGRRLFRPLVELLARARVSPNAVTLTALPFSIAAAWLFASGRLIWAGAALAGGGLCDLLDGELSRLSGRQSDAGAFLDSTMDRFSEALVFVGISWYYRTSPALALLAVSALVLSLMVSYVRARAEGLGRDCSIGLFERPVRLLILLLGALAPGAAWLPIALGLVALGSAFTVGQRLVHVLHRRD
ncbi:MAG TPA: CDP-alcohol phosphatidyltransferase family protein [candidate division WOR-3 bacterium]|uniref:CDP-alcohol phosphatidyltransferase family protein n=1 Tax=candidate division WOR-3 bacterium TaxID=2052148 RepID=A0A7V0T5S2_UNCW3|nr:CDP-alcohol phosphatidyltransferase family protein [candidate division WOR-3 bacterium]